MGRKSVPRSDSVFFSSPGSSPVHSWSFVQWSACVFLGIGLVLASGSDSLAGNKKEVFLSVRDAVVLTGKPVRLEATLVEKALLKPLGVGGEVIEFFVGKTSIGTAMTGGDGRAYLEHVPSLRGMLTLTAHVVDNPRTGTAQAAATLASWERRRPILLVDIASLRSQEGEKGPSLLPFLVGQDADVSPIPDAAQELKRLTDYYYYVIYVDWREGQAGASGVLGMFSSDVRGWLTRHHFPLGVVVSLKEGPASLIEWVGALKAQGVDHLKWGVAGTRAFAEAMAELRIGTVWIVGATDVGRLPRKVQTVKAWTDVRKKL